MTKWRIITTALLIFSAQGIAGSWVGSAEFAPEIKAEPGIAKLIILPTDLMRHEVGGQEAYSLLSFVRHVGGDVGLHALKNGFITDASRLEIIFYDSGARPISLPGTGQDLLLKWLVDGPPLKNLDCHGFLGFLTDRVYSERNLNELASSGPITSHRCGDIIAIGDYSESEGKFKFLINHSAMNLDKNRFLFLTGKDGFLAIAELPSLLSMYRANCYLTVPRDRYYKVK